EHPLLWPSLAHETGGHDALHADPGLPREPAHRGAHPPHLPPRIRRPWAGWMGEGASPGQRLPTIGPSLSVSPPACFLALRASTARRKPKLGAISNMLQVQGNVPLDVHPVDILRIPLAIGVTPQLTSLSASAKGQWLDMLGSLVTEAAGGATSIDV